MDKGLEAGIIADTSACQPRKSPQYARPSARLDSFDELVYGEMNDGDVWYDRNLSWGAWGLCDDEPRFSHEYLIAM